MLLSIIKRTYCFIAVAVLLALTGCAARQVPPSASVPNGLHHVEASFRFPAFDEFKYADGIIVGYRDLKSPSSMDIKYNDGDRQVIGTQPIGQDEVQRTNYAALAPFCRTAACVTVNYNDHFYAFSPLDSQALMDTELWVFTDLDAKEHALKFQGCYQGKIYSSSNLQTLMDVLESVEQPGGVSSDSGAKYLVSEDKLTRRFPICDWRHRVGLDAIYPQPPNEAKVRFVPASHSHGAYVETKADHGVFVDVYLDDDHRQLNKIVFKSAKGSLMFRPLYDSNDCPILDRCEHFALGPEKQPDRFDLHSLDDEPLSQSRIFAVNDTIGHVTYYDGCAGGRLYSGKNRDEVEREVKDALANPAPPPVKGAPVFGAPETSESGDVVIPDAFCDGTYRRQQAQALMKKSPPAQ